MSVRKVPSRAYSLSSRPRIASPIAPQSPRRSEFMLTSRGALFALGGAMEGRYRVCARFPLTVLAREGNAGTRGSSSGGLAGSARTPSTGRAGGT